MSFDFSVVFKTFSSWMKILSLKAEGICSWIGTGTGILCFIFSPGSSIKFGSELLLMKLQTFSILSRSVLLNWWTIFFFSLTSMVDWNRLMLSTFLNCWDLQTKAGREWVDSEVNFVSCMICISVEPMTDTSSLPGVWWVTESCWSQCRSLDPGLNTSVAGDTGAWSQARHWGRHLLGHRDIGHQQADTDWHHHDQDHCRNEEADSPRHWPRCSYQRHGSWSQHCPPTTWFYDDMTKVTILRWYGCAILMEGRGLSRSLSCYLSGQTL